MKRKNLPKLLLLLMLLLTSTTALASPKVSRIAGENRFETAKKISELTSIDSHTLFVSDGFNFKDIFLAANIARHPNSNLFIVDPVNSTTTEEINRLNPETIFYICENPNPELVKKLKSFNKTLCVWDYGDDNSLIGYTNALNITKAIATPKTYADALASLPYLEKKHALLTFGEKYTNEDIVIGGENSVKGGNKAPIQFSGETRFDTALQIAKEIDANGAILASGENFVDASMASRLAKKYDYPILLTGKDKIPSNVYDYLKDKEEVIIVGGEASVSKKVENSLTTSISEENEDLPKYKVTRVIDGDTIVLNINGKDEKVRLIGVDTPESVHPYKTKNSQNGQIASSFTKEKLEGQTVGLELDVQERDKYGRILGYVYIGDTMFNKLLIQEGMAQIATFPPNVKYVGDFEQLEKTARDSKKGFWNGTDFSNNTKPSKPEKPKENKPKQPPTPGPYEKAYIYANGRIIGNKNSGIYHVPRGRDYKKVAYKNAVFFDTPQEARQAGYRAAKR